MRDTISWPPRDASRRGSAFLGIVIMAVLISIVTFAYSAARGRVSADHPLVVPATGSGGIGVAPGGSTGAGISALPTVSMRDDTRLRLLVADPTVILDIATGATTPIPGLPEDGRRVYEVRRVGRTAVIVGTRACLDCVPSGEAYVLRDGAAVSLGPAWSVAPSVDGRGVWILHYVDERRCMLREVGLDGELRHRDRPIDCRARMRKETPAGLLVDIAAQRSGQPESALLEPATAGAIGRYPHIDAVTQHFTLNQVPGRSVSTVPRYPQAAGHAGGGTVSAHGGFVLTDLRSGRRQTLPWPSRLDRTDGAAADPRGRYLAVAFAGNPSGGTGELLDLWVLDTVARQWQQLPGMPVPTNLEHTSTAWTPDGRLVILGSFDESGDVVAIWRPGDDRLAMRRVELPDQRSNDSFAVLPLATPSGDATAAP